ncbi:MAG: FHA domain-containing protein [Anaerolineae bacterium]|nr:FHA domain-containing protein [Anaerolineae bacterium]
MEGLAMSLPAYIALTFMSGPRDGETARFETPPQAEQLKLSFGRRETCDVCLTYDSQVSRIHAQLTFDGEHFWLEDLNSRNGTFVEKQRVTDQLPLKPGDLFRVGRTWLRLEPLHAMDTLTVPDLYDDDIPF